MQSPRLLPILLALAFAATALPAEDGTLTLHVKEAVALQKNNDDIFNPQQDFFVIMGLDTLTHKTRTIQGRDDAWWDTPPELLGKLVPGENQRFFTIHLELWDEDSFGFQQSFDINPLNGTFPTGAFPDLSYDVCTGTMIFNGTSTVAGVNAAEITGAGTPGPTDRFGRIRFSVTRNPANWLPMDVAITRVSPFQVDYDQARVVAQKPTSVQVEVASTYPFPQTAPMTVMITDSVFSDTDTKLVTIQPGVNEIVFFEGSTRPPFLPFKSLASGTGKLTATATIQITETASPNAPPALKDCANLNNTAKSSDMPIVITQDPKTVYFRYDYDPDDNFISTGDLSGMYTREETFRGVTWPLASVNSSWSAAPATETPGLGEPWNGMLGMGMWAMTNGIGRVVLATRNGWFADNASRHLFVPSYAIGVSMGGFSRAVIAEDGYYANAVHELGHSYWQSQHKCSNGGIAEDLFGLGCLDEYNHVPSDGRPYEAMGFDVTGAIYPSGDHETTNPDPTIQCPATTPVGRDVCAANVMDLSYSDGYHSWVDTLTFHDLMDKLQVGPDPAVLVVSGSIDLPNGFGDGSVIPVITGSLPFFDYQFDGVADLPDAPISANGETFSGTGAFRVRLRAPSGVHDYRFNPRFFHDDTSGADKGAFQLEVPWDAATTRIELIGPTDVRVADCQNKLCTGDGIVLAARDRSATTPTISNLRAGIDVAPPGPSPAPVVVGPGHSAVIAWNPVDPDSGEVRSIVSVQLQPGVPGGAGPSDPSIPVPVALDAPGNQVVLSHDRLVDQPGTYFVKILASDGINTSQVTSTPIFTICNLTHGGVEICDGIDNDCNGVTDDAARPGGAITLTGQRIPGGGSSYSWPSDPASSSYDVVYGSLTTLRSTQGNFTPSILGCLANDAGGTSVSLAANPAPGSGYFVVLRGNNCGGAGTYDSGAASQSGSRDAEIAASALACAP